jgi:DNA-binding CsgD family transcriptional regulator
MSQLCRPLSSGASTTLLRVRDTQNLSREMVRMTNAELRGALDALHAIGDGCASSNEFARRGVECLPRLVRSELTTLSVCNLDNGHRSVVSDQAGAISPREIEAFDRYFFAHPLVCEHGRNPCAVTKRISDLLPETEFQRTPLYGDYYRSIRIDHVMAVPIHVDRHYLVSFVLNRSKRNFSDRDRAYLELIRPHLGNVYRLSVAASRAEDAPASRENAACSIAHSAALTAREREVLQWLGAGKTDRDIGAILNISPRTVHKHLQRIYEKLGVETRTAAVMRTLALRRQPIGNGIGDSNVPFSPVRGPSPVQGRRFPGCG